MNIEDCMRPISDAARIVRATLPPGHGFELSDLVSIGVERVLTYLRGTPGAQPALVFVCAKQGMLYESRRWIGKDPHALQGEKKRKSPDPILTGHHEWMGTVPTPPIAEMIDMKRALLSMQLREAVAWYSHHWLCEELDHLETELGVSEGRIRQYCRTARDKLAAAWKGDGFESEDQKRARKASAEAEAEARRRAAHAEMLSERRSRYADLRQLGVSGAEAAKAASTRARYATLCQKFKTEAAA